MIGQIGSTLSTFMRSSMLLNRDLRKFYNIVYRKGEEKHYTKLMLSQKRISEEKEAILNAVAWKAQTVLDVGCGTGELAALIAKRTRGSVLGIDFSKEAIKTANRRHKHPNIAFKCADLKTLSGAYDVIIMAGTIEHMDDPFSTLERLTKMMRRRGSVIVTAPNWSNPRGYILLALKELFGGKITLADLHYLTPLEFEGWSARLKLRLSYYTIEHSWGYGEKLIADLRKRLPRIAETISPNPSKRAINSYLKWLEEHLPRLEKFHSAGGAVGVYHFRRRSHHSSRFNK